MDKFLLLAVSILLPAIAAALCHIIKKRSARWVIVILTSVALVVTAVLFAVMVKKAGGRIEMSFDVFALDAGWIIKFLDLALLVYIIYLGLSLKKLIISILAVLQFFLVVFLEVFVNAVETKNAFVIDHLSLAMIFPVSIIGPVIVLFALGYMDGQEHHNHNAKSKQPRFFMMMFVLLAAMNALTMTNDLMGLYFFWKVTTLCLFLLISHDGNAVLVDNAVRALWMNMLGGVAFIVGNILIYKSAGTLAIDELTSMGSGTPLVGVLPMGLGILCFLGFVISIRMSFQSWLQSAAVEHIPVSVVLNSSAIVMAGIYLMVRLAPIYGGTPTGKVIAAIGGFTFLAASALTISRREAK